MLLQSIKLKGLCPGTREVMCVHLKELDTSLPVPFCSSGTLSTNYCLTLWDNCAQSAWEEIKQGQQYSKVSYFHEVVSSPVFSSSVPWTFSFYFHCFLFSPDDDNVFLIKKQTRKQTKKQNKTQFISAWGDNLIVSSLHVRGSEFDPQNTHEKTVGKIFS